MGKETSAADYYEVLQVNPRADREIIERAYRLLAKRYHPDNRGTGDSSTFDILVEAYRTLSDPDKRAAYDDNHKTSNAYQNDIFSSGLQPGEIDEERRTNQAILLIFYFARRRDSTNPEVGIVDLEKALGVPEKEMEFHIWYLKEKGWIRREDTGALAITASGVDQVIGSNLSLRKDSLLPLIRESSLGKSNSDEKPN